MRLLGSVVEFVLQRRIGVTVAMRTVAMKDIRAGGIIRMLTMPCRNIGATKYRMMQQSKNGGELVQNMHGC